ncbi:MAG: DUF3290 domain-containing protein, partial [Lactococcus lactis]|nr:DUF3290 domain-containing protein [Lactococcus lactis]
SIILLLFIILEIGIQYSNYQINQSKHTQSSQMVGFIERVAKNERTNKNNIFVNSTQLADGVIVKIKGDYYKVNLSADQQSYTLTKSYLINPEK